MNRKLFLVSLFYFITKLFLPSAVSQSIGSEKCILELIPEESSFSFGLNQPVNWLARITNNTNKILIGKIIFEVKTFTSVMVKLFHQMSKLKYIGDQPDSGVVIGETVEPKKPEPKRGWSFLND